MTITNQSINTETLQEQAMRVTRLYLEQRGWKVEEDLHDGYLVAVDTEEDDTTVLVEVRGMPYREDCLPDLGLTGRDRNFFEEHAKAYAAENGLDWVRFDVSAIGIKDESSAQLRYLFGAQWCFNTWVC